MSQKAQENPLKAIADEMRTKTGVEWRSAVLLDKRVEFIRGKDFVAYLRAHEDKMHPFVAKSLKPEEQIRGMGELMLRKHFFVKADRMFKKPKPGKKRLAKWPKKLVPMQDPAFTEEHFYAWMYERPASPYLFAFSVLLVVAVLAVCLFPLAPQPLKLAVVYLSMALIILIFAVLIVRSIIASITWVALGRSLWLFPHLLSEEKGLDEAFWPVFELDEYEAKRGNHWAIRLLLAGGLVMSFWAAYTYAPNKGAVRDGAVHAHDAILEMLNLHDARLGRLGGGSSDSSGPGVKLDL